MEKKEKQIAAFVVVNDILAEALFFLKMILTICDFQMHSYYKKYYDKAKYSMLEKMDSQNKYLESLVNYSDRVCLEQLRMNRDTFMSLCALLRDRAALAGSKYVSLEEKVASFLYILGHHTKNRVLQFNLKRSGHTVSVYFHEVLNGVLRLQSHLLVKPEPILPNCRDERWKMFQGCLGALDGTYIRVNVPEEDKKRYRSRKGEISMNVLGVCDRNMNFVFIFPGWEGSATDSRVLRDAVTRPNGLVVPQGQYYLCDAGYTNGPGFLAPYRRRRYHLATWDDNALEPQNYEEYFNMKHAKARNVIERCFGVLKIRWGILRGPSNYSVKVHSRIVIACCLLHNFIRKEMSHDPFEDEYDNFQEDNITHEQDVHEEESEMITTIEATDEWQEWRANLAQTMYNAWIG